MAKCRFTAPSTRLRTDSSSPATAGSAFNASSCGSGPGESAGVALVVVGVGEGGGGTTGERGRLRGGVSESELTTRRIFGRARGFCRPGVVSSRFVLSALSTKDDLFGMTALSEEAFVSFPFALPFGRHPDSSTRRRGSVLTDRWCIPQLS